MTMSILSIVIFIIIMGSGKLFLHLKYHTGHGSIKDLTSRVEREAKK